ncbi:MAG: type II toxin-antitoxin system HicB family antitoxin [Methanosarcinales archaeon]|nr:type II toxin-antitoxin system HicB family antitoxin [Methanosarcinales archaeon]
MLTDYINRALSTAEYDKLDDGTFYGKIPACIGVLAFGTTLFECENELRSTLEGWLIVKIRFGDVLPVIDGFDINKGIPSGNGVAVHA